MQAEGCPTWLGAKGTYHRRYRVCDEHMKSLNVTVAGCESRYCQQVGRATASRQQRYCQQLGQRIHVPICGCFSTVSGPRAACSVGIQCPYLCVDIACQVPRWML